MKRVIAFGSFDLLHPGHLLYLKRARALGDFLIVVVARDESIKKIKGRSPVMDEKSRLMLISELRCVDRAVLGKRLSEGVSKYEIFRKYKPDIIVLGYDQRVDLSELKAWLSSNKINAKVVRIRGRADDKVFKSSLIKKRLAIYLKR